MSEIIRIDTISQVHQALGLEKPAHPLVSILPIDERITNYEYGDHTYVYGFYQVSLKIGIQGEIQYGKKNYDFSDGTVVFTKPNQAISYAGTSDSSETGGWALLFHPDLIRNSSLGREIEHYSFFSYEVDEALHLSESERDTLSAITEKISEEYQHAIDRHTQGLIVSNIELLLSYCTRYYERQFHLRENLHSDYVTRFESLLGEYFDTELSLDLGLPTVKYCGEQLAMSPSYLSDVLKRETGRTAQQHIQDAITERAKTMLLATDEQVSQIAYSLGFEYPQHLSKFFKARTGMSPIAYRRSN